MYPEFSVIIQIWFWASRTPKEKRKISNVVNYKCHRSLKEKQTSSLEETRLLCGPHVDYAVVGIFMVRADARLVNAPALEIVKAPL